MRHWQWWHVAGLWLVVILVTGFVLRPYVNVFSARAVNGDGGIRAIGGPLWLPIVLLAVLVGLLVVTWGWWRGQGRV